MEAGIPESVDQLLLEQGEYLPLEFLLAQGRLMYADYETWRAGGVVLDELLFGDRRQIVQDLAAAAAYAQALGLVAMPLSYTRWGGADPLRVSQDPALSPLLHAGYQKPQDRPQLDLFMDNIGVGLVNGIAAALGRRDPAEAARLLEQLYRADPGHSRLGGLERLVDAALTLDVAVTDPGAEIAILERELLPLSEDLLGNRGRHFLVPLWRRLHQSLAAHGFDVSHPECHQSYTAIGMQDWAQALAAVEAEAAWRCQPVLLQRHAQACTHLRRASDALLDLFALCWQFPAQAAAVAGVAAADTRRAWELFRELDPELPIASFPAWLLLLRPAAINWLPQPDSSQPPSYQLIYRLQASPDGASAENVRLRAELKALDADLFRHFIRNVAHR